MRYIVVLACGLTLLAQPQKSNDPERWLQSAIQAETVDGDLKSAIEQYKKIIGKSGASREVVAKALVRLGMCYERQGNAEAGKQYQRVVREFADQASAVAEAREMLAKLNSGSGPKSAVLTARQIWTGKDTGGSVPNGIAPTADGKSLLFVDPQSGDAAARDLATGEIKRIGFKKSWAESRDYALYSLYSPDQRQIAYAWYSPGESPVNSYWLRVVSVEPGAKPRDLISGPEVSYIWPDAWSPDGKSILTRIWKTNRTLQIAWVSVADGSLRIVKSFDQSKPKGVSLSSDARYIAYATPERIDSTDADIFVVTADGTSEAAVVRSPGDDSNPVWTPDGKNLVFTSNRSRNTGLYAISVQDGKAVGPAKLLKPEIGQVELSRFVSSGALYYTQTTGSQNVYRVDVDLSTGKVRNAPVALGNGATNNGMSSLSPDGKRVAYLAARGRAQVPSFDGSSGPGAVAVMVKSLDGVIENSFPVDVDLGWAPMWFSEGNALLLSGRRVPRGTGQAFYRLDLDSGRLSTLLENQVNYTQPGDARGQRELSADGQTVYVSLDWWGPLVRPSSRNVPGGVFALSLSNGQVKKVYETKGAVRAVSISPDNQALAVIADGKLIVMATDGVNPRTLVESRDVNLYSGVAWSSDGKHVFFVHNGRESELWRVPVSGGDAAPTGISGVNIREIRGGPNGALTYTAGQTDKAELWALDNLLPMLKALR